MNYRNSFRRMSIALTFVLWLGSLAAAQTSRGTVSGTVTDSTGAVIAGAKVELTNKGTGVTRSTVTNSVGLYRFDAVDLGVYDLKIAQTGFKQYVKTDIGVEANRT